MVSMPYTKVLLIRRSISHNLYRRMAIPKESGMTSKMKLESEPKAREMRKLVRLNGGKTNNRRVAPMLERRSTAKPKTTHLVC